MKSQFIETVSLDEVFIRYHGNHTEVARRLGIGRNTLYNIINNRVDYVIQVVREDTVKFKITWSMKK